MLVEAALLSRWEERTLCWTVECTWGTMMRWINRIKTKLVKTCKFTIMCYYHAQNTCNRLQNSWHSTKFWNFLDECRTTAKKILFAKFFPPPINVDYSFRHYGHFVSGQHCAGGGGDVLPRFGMLENSPKTVKCVINFETDCGLIRKSCKSFRNQQLLVCCEKLIHILPRHVMHLGPRLKIGKKFQWTGKQVDAVSFSNERGRLGGWSLSGHCFFFWALRRTSCVRNIFIQTMDVH